MEKSPKQESPLVVEAIKAIHISIPRGDGSDNNPVRIVEQYWSFNGELLAERDPIG